MRAERYARAGVDLDAGERAKARIAEIVASTRTTLSRTTKRKLDTDRPKAGPHPALSMDSIAAVIEASKAHARRCERTPDQNPFRLPDELLDNTSLTMRLIEDALWDLYQKRG